MTGVDPNQVAALIRAVAEAEILPRFGRLLSHQIREKGPGDLVTEADIEAERALEAGLTALLPGSVVVGEEACSADLRVLERLTGDAPVWVIDPVDGTTNFAEGRSTFGVIVALVRDGATRMGWIHDPLRNVTAFAAEGRGAWMDGRRLLVAEAAPLAALSGALGFRRGQRVVGKVAQLVRQGSAAHDYLALLEGRLHFAAFRKLRPWDHAAGVLLHGEAGGRSAQFDGSPYRPVMSDGGLLLAADEAMWRELRGLID